MSAAVRPLRLSPAVAVPSAASEPVDYCQCNRGPVVGAVSYTSNRMVFFPIGSDKAAWDDYAPDLRCVDCLADTALSLADGTVRALEREQAEEHREAILALARRSQISVAAPSRQTSPSKGDQVT